jgi:hypothetical protein
MKRVFSLLLTLMFVVQFVAAQQSLYVLSKGGEIVPYPASKASSANDLFAFTYGEITEITKKSFASSFNVAFKSDENASLVQTYEVGVCFSDINKTPTIYDGKAAIGTALDNHAFRLNALDSGTTYYYRAYIKINNVVCYGSVQQQTTLGEKPSSEYKVVNGHKFVDLGLPSGLLWAANNLCAGTAADAGEYFAWGETSAKDSYSWDTYTYGTSKNLTKYNTSDDKAVLEKEDDAAYVNWGSPCRMPTYEEFEELLDPNNCTWTWTQMRTSANVKINGYDEGTCKGLQITSKKNGNSIFIPASGSRSGETLSGYRGFIKSWSSTLCSGIAYDALFLSFNGNARWQNYDYRCYGLTIRPVAESSATQEGEAKWQDVKAQQNNLVASDKSKEDAVGVSSGNNSAFDASKGLFSITNNGLEGISKTKISASCTASLAAVADVKSFSITPEVGVCYSKDKTLPTIDDECKTLGSELKSYTFALSPVVAGTTYYYRVYVKLANSVFYGDVAKAQTLGAKPNDKIINGHKFLDLGLPSGLLWAETNIGAATAPDYGSYFAWGETVPKARYHTDTYKFYKKNFGYTKYTQKDGKKVLEKRDDAAFVNWGAECRMPTDEEFEELRSDENCTWSLTQKTNASNEVVDGYQITSKINGNSIFLPKASYRSLNDLTTFGGDSLFYYWTSTIIYESCAYNLGAQGNREYGSPIRPVAEH